jgi:methionyl-tRNA formyltransferase
MIPIVFMGSPELAVPSLRALVEAAPRNGAEVKGVFAQPDRPVGRHRQPQPCPVAAETRRLGIPLFTPVKLRGPEGETALQSLAPALVVVCAYGHILPQRVLDLPPLGCFNLHFSLLPRWRGASPVQAAILAGDTETGVTLQRMVAQLDAGPVAAASAPEPVRPDDTAASLGRRLADIAAALLVRALPGLLNGQVMLTPQDPAQVTTCRILRKEDGAIDWEHSSAVEVERKVRAYTPWPGCHGFLGGRRLVLVRVAVAQNNEAAAAQSAAPGTLLPGGLVACAQGRVRLLRVKPEGKGEMAWDDFARGMPQITGLRLTPRAP